MRQSRRSGAILVLVASFSAALLAAGCEQPDEREHAVNWSSDGRFVAFHQGTEGVFLSAPDGSHLRKIFEPKPGTSAVSAPMWSPTDSRLIFTTARPDPDAKKHARLYTC